MTKGAALHDFFNRFLTFYAATSVPEDAAFPYGTYECSVAAMDGGEVSILANLWYYTDSEATPNAKVQEISEAIGVGGVVLACDGGRIWIKRGSPFAQSVADESNSGIKRRYINLSVEYLTAN